MRNSEIFRRCLGEAFVALCIFVLLSTGAATAADNSLVKKADGLAVYLGVVPAEIVKGPAPHSAERPMHGRIPAGRHEHHVVAAIFDTASGARVSDATVTAKISGLGLSGPQSKLEPMKIADTITYGAFIYLPGADFYTIRLTISRPGMPRPVVMEFKYDHRRR